MADEPSVPIELKTVKLPKTNVGVQFSRQKLEELKNIGEDLRKRGYLEAMPHKRGKVTVYKLDNGVIHRDAKNGPAVIVAKGNYVYHLYIRYGLLHRDHGPAVELFDLCGNSMDAWSWWEYGIKHRRKDMGPAEKKIDGTTAYWVSGRRVNKSVSEGLATKSDIGWREREALKKRNGHPEPCPIPDFSNKEKLSLEGYGAFFTIDVHAHGILGASAWQQYNDDIYSYMLAIYGKKYIKQDNGHNEIQKIRMYADGERFYTPQLRSRMALLALLEGLTRFPADGRDVMIQIKTTNKYLQKMFGEQKVTEDLRTSKFRQLQQNDWILTSGAQALHADILQAIYDAGNPLDLWHGDGDSMLYFNPEL